MDEKFCGTFLIDLTADHQLILNHAQKVCIKKVILVYRRFEPLYVLYMRQFGKTIANSLAAGYSKAETISRTRIFAQRYLSLAAFFTIGRRRVCYTWNSKSLRNRDRLYNKSLSIIHVVGMRCLTNRRIRDRGKCTEKAETRRQFLYR